MDLTELWDRMIREGSTEQDTEIKLIDDIMGQLPAEVACEFGMKSQMKKEC